MILKGKSVSGGAVQGKTHVLDASTVLASALKVPPHGSPNEEIERLNAALGKASVQLDRLRRQLTGKIPSQDVGIFAAHSGLLRDSKFLRQIEAEIQEQRRSAEAAVARVVKEIYAGLKASIIPLAQDKAYDVLDIGRRLVNCLATSTQAEDELPPHAVIVAGSLTPSELVRFAHQGAAGFITETCGQKSHTAILARGFGLPLVTNVTTAVDNIPHDVDVLIDADEGLIILEPDQGDEQQAQVIRNRISVPQSTEAEDLTPATRDGTRITLLLNISDPTEADSVAPLQAAGIGLFRTEFLYIDRSWWPSVEESLEIYRDVSSRVGSAELNVRLVDFGAEKCPPYADIPLNRNPSLGLRGIRLLLQREDILRPQVLALEKLSRERSVTVQIPMLDTLDTLNAVIEKLCRLCGCRYREQLPFKLGTMIEVPAAAILIEDLLPNVDSLSIGLNDLTQYLLAADRDDELVGPFHDALQPAVLRLVRKIVEAADKAEKPVTICGELAGDLHLTGVMLALGIRRFSVSRSSYRRVIRNLKNLSLENVDALGRQVLDLPTGAAVRHFVAEHFQALTPPIS